MKILATADLGLKNHSFGGVDPVTGLNRRFLDIYKTFTEIVDLAIKDKYKFFIISGDINEERNPESILIEKFCIQIKRLLDAEIKTIIVAGNHDLDSSIGSSTSISYLKALNLPNLYIADKGPERWEWTDLDITFHCFPYVMRETLGFNDNLQLTSHLNNLISNPVKTTKHNICVAHYSLDKVFEGLNIDEPIIYTSSVTADKYDAVILGHIHKYESYDKYNVMGGYPGSIYIKDFGENTDKFVNSIDVTDKGIIQERIKLSAREFAEFNLDIRDECLSTNDEIYTLIESNLRGQITDKVVKLNIISGRRFNPKPIYEFLRNEKTFHYVPISWHIISDKSEATVENISTSDDNSIIQQYLNSLKLDENRRDNMFKFIKEVIDESTSISS